MTTKFDTTDRAVFIQRHTDLIAPPLVPELKLHLATEDVDLWQMSEEELDEAGLPPPFWAFAWAGGQALARHLMDHHDLVKGKRVLDFAAGSGLQGFAAVKAGADHVTAVEIDGFAIAAIQLNAAANGIQPNQLDTLKADIVGDTSPEWDVVLAGDVCYDRDLADRVEVWLRDMVARGATVLIGDPGRHYLPDQGLEKLETYEVRVTRALEDMEIRKTSVWRMV